MKTLLTAKSRYNDEVNQVVRKICGTFMDNIPTERNWDLNNSFVRYVLLSDRFRLSTTQDLWSISKTARWKFMTSTNQTHHFPQYYYILITVNIYKYVYYTKQCSCFYEVITKRHPMWIGSFVALFLNFRWIAFMVGIAVGNFLCAWLLIDYWIWIFHIFLYLKTYHIHQNKVGLFNSKLVNQLKYRYF